MKYIITGEIKFSISDLGNGAIRFDINSVSNVDQGMAKTFAESFSRKEQKASCNEVLNNAIKLVGGTEDKSKRKETVTR